jgi:hypothetical protein
LGVAVDRLDIQVLHQSLAMPHRITVVAVLVRGEGASTRQKRAVLALQVSSLSRNISREAVMAIDYKTSSDLMNDANFNGRTRIACLTYASYISNEANSVPAHNTRLKWAQSTFADSENAVNMIMPILIMDDKVKTSGAAIIDSDLQSAVETSVNKTI